VEQLSRLRLSLLYVYENVLEKCWSVNNLDLLYDSIFHGIFLCGSFPCLAAREEIELIQVPHETVNNANCHRLLIIAASRAISLDFYYQYLIVFIISCMYINVKVCMYKFVRFVSPQLLSFRLHYHSAVSNPCPKVSSNRSRRRALQWRAGPILVLWVLLGC